MRVRTAVLVLLALALVPAPAAGQAPSALVAPDPCGDADERLVGVMGSSVALGGGGANDLARTTVRPVPGGIDVVVEACGEIGSPSVLSRSWSVDLTTARGQQLNVGLGEFEGQRRADVALSEDGRFVAGMRFDAGVAGRTITFELRRSLLPAALAEALAPGAVLSRPLTRTADSRTRVGDDTAFAATPGAQDESAGSGSIVLG